MGTSSEPRAYLLAPAPMPCISVLALSLVSDLSAVYELSRTLSPPLEPWILGPTPCSVPRVSQATSWLALTCPCLSQEPVPNPILSSWATSYLILLHPSVSLLSQPSASETFVHSCHLSPYSCKMPTHMHTAASSIKVERVRGTVSEVEPPNWSQLSMVRPQLLHLGSGVCPRSVVEH